MNWILWFVGAPVMLAYLIGTLGYLYHLYRGKRILLNDVSRFRLCLKAAEPGQHGLELLDSEQDQDMKQLVTAEGVWDVFQSFLGFTAVLLAAWAGLSHSARALSVWVIVGLPLAIRAKMQECRLMKTSFYSLVEHDLCKWTSYPSFPFLLSIPTAIDGFCHGTVAAEAFLVGDLSVELGILWGSGPFSDFRRPIQWLGYGGLMLCALFCAAIWHLGQMATSKSGSGPIAIAASLAGFGALERKESANLTTDDSHGASAAKFFVKVWGESVLFLELSVSMAMALAIKGNRSVTSDPILFVNVVLSAFSAFMSLKNYVSALSYGAHVAIYEDGDEREVVAVRVLIDSIPAFIVAFSVALKVFTFAIADSCPRHAWGITTGCV